MIQPRQTPGRRRSRSRPKTRPLRYSPRAVIFGGVLILAALWMQHQARAAEAHHDLEAIRQSVSEFLSHKLGADPAARIVVNPLDQRLRVAACPQPLKPWLPSSSKLLGPTTVGVRCLGESPWTLYVSARIERYTDIQIAARPWPEATLSAPETCAPKAGMSAACGQVSSRRLPNSSARWCAAQYRRATRFVPRRSRTAI